MSSREFITRSSEETVALGRELSGQWKPPILVMLRGELGSGKTTLAKGVVSGLGAAREEDVTSPTFTLVHEFRNARTGVRVYHVDLYRVENFASLETLGLEDALSEPGIVIVEWAEKLKLRTDWPIVEICLAHEGDEGRRIVVVEPVQTPAAKTT